MNQNLCHDILQRPRHLCRYYRLRSGASHCEDFHKASLESHLNSSYAACVLESTQRRLSRVVREAGHGYEGDSPTSARIAGVDPDRLFLPRYDCLLRRGLSMALPETTFESYGHSVSISGLDDDEYIFGLIKQDRQFYEFDLLDFVRGLPLGGGSVVDVGANLGNHTVFFALVMQRRTHAFEVSSKNRNALTVNVEANGIGELVVVHDFGLHSEDAMATILENPENMGQTRVISIGSDEGSAVVLKRLDSVIPPDERVALIKVDVEGAELDVLCGAEAVLDRDMPVCLVEGHPGLGFDALGLFFAERGFSPVQILGRSDNWVFVHSDRLEFLQPYIDAYAIRIQTRMLASNDSRLRSLQIRADQTSQGVAVLRDDLDRFEDQLGLHAWSAGALGDEVRASSAQIQDLGDEARALSAQIKDLAKILRDYSRRADALFEKVVERLVPLRRRIMSRLRRGIEAGARGLAANEVTRRAIMIVAPRRIRRRAAHRFLGRRPQAQKSLGKPSGVLTPEPDPLNPLPERPSYEMAVICTAYPGGKRVYGGEFVQTRVEKYGDLGHRALVIESSLGNERPRLEHSDTADVLRISPQHLGFFIRFLEPTVAAFLTHSPSVGTLAELTRVVPQDRQIHWFHGYSVRDYRRLYFNYTTPELARSRGRLDDINRERLSAAATCFANPRSTKVFVSEFLRRVAETDTGQKAVNSHVIPNFVDGDFFRFAQRTPDQARRMLLIRSFANRNYANDIAIESIELLSKRPGFNDLQFTIRGFGPEFGPLTERLSDLSNVDVEEGLLSRDAVAILHASHGVFLCPTRFDTQGVSMGEAMASGMVVVTNDTTAIPEYTDPDCSVLVRPDDPVAFADALWELYEHPERLPEMSRRASERVRAQCGLDQTIERELALIEKATQVLKMVPGV